MADLIDRQAAIDAVLADVDDGSRPITEVRWWNMGLTRASEILKLLPSAQPDLVTVNIDHELTPEEYEKLLKVMANAPIMLSPSAQPNLQPTCNQLATDEQIVN